MTRIYSLLVIGNNPEELLQKFDKNIQVEPYIKYYYKDANKLRSTAIKTHEALLGNKEKFKGNQFVIDSISEKIKELESITDFAYYNMLTNGYDYDDEGNAITNENPHGKFDSYEKGDTLAHTLFLKDDKPTFEALKKDIDWPKMHLTNQDTYIQCWNLFNNVVSPVTAEDKAIMSNMGKYKDEIMKFGSAENYAAFNTAYWECAVIDINKEWHDFTEETRYDWTTSFYDKYIKDIPEDTLLTIYSYKVIE